MTLSAIGDGENVRLSGQLNFAKPLELDLEPWRVPTNLIHDPLRSFTALRGIRPWLSSLQAWEDLQLGEPPNQLYWWGQGDAPLLTFCAAPLADARNRVAQAAERLSQGGNAWLTNHHVMGKFQRSTNEAVVRWLNMPLMEPYLRATAADGRELVLAGSGGTPFTNRPAPAGLFEQFLDRTNVVCYDWELTAQRVDACLYIAQFIRFIFHKAQVPPNSVSVAWLHALAPWLGNCGTVVTRTGPQQLSFLRKSSLGLTGAELQLLVDWLESPAFPRGLNTFVAPSPAPAAHRPRTNAPPPPPK